MNFAYSVARESGKKKRTTRKPSNTTLRFVTRTLNFTLNSVKLLISLASFVGQALLKNLPNFWKEKPL